MSLPAKRGRPILPKVRTKTASVMMVVDGCGNSLVKIELFHLFYCRDAVNLLQHNKHGLVVDCNKRIVFAPEQRCMAVADLCSVIGCLFMYFFEGLVPLNIDIFDSFSGKIKVRKFPPNLFAKHENTSSLSNYQS